MVTSFIRLLSIIFLVIELFSISFVFAEAKVGAIVPDCQLSQLSHDISTTGMSLSELRGQVIYVDFWASWCPPCVKSFPFLNQLELNLKDKGFQVIGVNLDEDVADAKDFLNRYPAEFLIALDPDKQCAKDLNVIAMPSSYLIDRKGMIRKIHHGFRMGDVQGIQFAIERVLAEP